MNGTIYLLRNKVNSKIYIGQTRRTLSERIKDHCSKRSKQSTIITRAIHKYGIDNFDIEVLDTNIPSQKQLDELEILYISCFKSRVPSGYNATDGGYSGNGKRSIDKIHHKEIVDLYTSGKSKNYIAKIYGVYPGTIGRILKENNTTSRNYHECQFSIPLDELENIKSIYDETGSLKEISNKYNCSTSAVLRFLRYHNISRKTTRGKRKVILTKDEFIELYNQHPDNKTLALYLSVADNTITYYKRNMVYLVRNVRSKG